MNASNVTPHGERIEPGATVLISISRFTFRQLISKMRDGETMDDTVRRLTGLSEREPRLLKIALIDSMEPGEVLVIPWEQGAPRRQIRASVQECCRVIAKKHRRKFKLIVRIDGLSVGRIT